MLPEDHARLRACMTYRSLMDEFVEAATGSPDTDWFQRNATAFLEVCDLFGQTAAQHHDLLVRRFIEVPAAALRPEHLSGITASGPPLPVLMRALEVLRDSRTAAPRADIPTRHRDIAYLRGKLRCKAELAAQRPAQ
jgi:hypothetical protein